MVVRYTATVANSGLDVSVNPEWQMVPVGGTRVLIVTGADGLVPRVRNPDPRNPALTAVKTGTGAATRLTLTGGRVAGRAWVEWVPSAGFVGPVVNGFALEVSIKAEKQVRTAFHYVNDGRRQVTTRQIADLDPLIAGVNAVLSPQANVTVVKRSAAALPVAQNLGRVVRFSAHLPGIRRRQHEWDDLLALSDRAADLNVFFVREYEQDNTPHHDDFEAGTIAADKMCVFEDNVGHDTAVTLAHETIHALGVAGHSANNTDVMATGAQGLGRFIPRSQINTINPSGT